MNFARSFVLLSLAVHILPARVQEMLERVTDRAASKAPSSIQRLLTTGILSRSISLRKTEDASIRKVPMTTRDVPIQFMRLQFPLRPAVAVHQHSTTAVLLGPLVLIFRLCSSRTVTCCAFILVLTNLTHKTCYNKFISCLYMFPAPCDHRQEVKIVLYSLWYHHTYRCAM